MGLNLGFADSFAHYDSAGIPLKWDSAGGSIETGSTHLRMGGPQSLRIQKGDSPSKLLAANGYTVTGFAWQTEVLSGEVIFEQWAVALVYPSPPERQLFLIQNSDGSISLWSGNDPTPTLIATSAPGVLTVDTWWYIEFSSELGLMGTPQCAVTITDATGNSVQVINTSGFTTTELSFDTLLWGGPTTPNYAWIDSFYFLSVWDGLGDPTVGLGAPKIYGQCIPISDGVPYAGGFNPTQPVPFPDTGPPWFSLVNSIPQDTSTFMLENQVIVDGVESGWPIQGRGFPVDVSGVPVGSPIAAVQLSILYSFMGGETIAFQGSPGHMIGYTGQSGPDFSRGSGNSVYASIPNIVIPFRFWCFGFILNPQTGLPWDLTEFTGSTALQFGPWVGEPS
jgi:hypothetical protein